jgi:hypothetical protein
MKIIGYRRLVPAVIGLALTLILAGCGAPGAAVSTPVPPTSVPAATLPPATVPPTSVPAQPTNVPAQPTSVPQPTGVPTSVLAPTSPAGQGDPTVAAVQTVLDYYTAINDKHLDDAYRLWANDGAASQQTLDQFKQGFANTVRVSLQLGEPKAGSGTNAVEVPVTLIAISNDPNPQNPQKVQQFQGSYTVLPGASGWRLSGASIAEASGNPLPPAQFADPAKELQNYYDLINKHELATAYTYWSQNGANSQQSFAQFAQGYAATSQATIELGKPESQGALGSIYIDVPAVIVAKQTDGSQQAFCGTYTLRGLNVPPFDKLGLRIEGAKIAATALVQPGSAEAQQLLNGGCKAA